MLRLFDLIGISILTYRVTATDTLCQRYLKKLLFLPFFYLLFLYIFFDDIFGMVIALLAKWPSRDRFVNGTVEVRMGNRLFHGVGKICA
jgi:hypothetical protein